MLLTYHFDSIMSEVEVGYDNLTQHVPVRESEVLTRHELFLYRCSL